MEAVPNFLRCSCRTYLVSIRECLFDLFISIQLLEICPKKVIQTQIEKETKR